MLGLNLPFRHNELPEPPPMRRLIGPSFIILGLGLGSGEVILWPYLASNYGLGIIWGALIGITIQFFINMEVERYALINGESIFVGFARMLKWLPSWFVLTTFLGFGWPGIGMAGATLLTGGLGFTNVRVVAVLLFITIGVILSAGRVLYQTVESIEKYLIGIGVPFVFLLAVFIAQRTDLEQLARGLVGMGEEYLFLPAGISLMTFLAALAYSGAGGNLNLAQSFYVRDKGYGMGKYAQKIKSVFTNPSGEEVPVSLAGTQFECTPGNIERFRRWWRVVNIEHALVFWFLGLLTMLLLALLSYATTFGLAGNASGINFVINEALAIGRYTMPVVGIAFLIVTGIMLVATQLTVLESTSRIITENVLLMRGDRPANVSKVFYAVLWGQILFGISLIMLGFDEPRMLITLGAVINAFAMFVYIGLLVYLNNRRLHPALRPSWWRNLIMGLAWLFFGIFSSLTIYAIWT